MPWSDRDYPDSMKNLPDNVRKKAIEIANALLDDDKDEGRAISIGIAQARKYYGHDDDRPEYHIIADGEEWILKKKDGKRAIIRKDTKEALMGEAKEYVNDHDGVLIIHKSDGDISQSLYN